MEILKPVDVDTYIRQSAKDVRPVLKSIRAIVKKMAPAAEELISYGIPTFKLDKKPLVYFAGFTSHVSLFPAISANEDFEKLFREYRTGKGTIQFPLNKPIPLELVERFVNFRLQEHTSRSDIKKASGKSSKPNSNVSKKKQAFQKLRGNETIKPNGFLTELSAPARRALANKGIDSLAALAKYSEKEIRRLHGIGKTSIPILKQALAEEGLSFAG